MTSKEKRRHIRIHSLNLSYVFIEGHEDADKQTMGRTLDVSETGIRLETHLEIEVGSQIMLSIGLENNVVDIVGRVVHSARNKDGRYELGIEFVNPGADVQHTLRSFIQAFRKQRGLSE